MQPTRKGGDKGDLLQGRSRRLEDGTLEGECGRIMMRLSLD